MDTNGTIVHPYEAAKRNNAVMEDSMRSTTYFAAVSAVTLSKGRARPSATGPLSK